MRTTRQKAQARDKERKKQAERKELREKSVVEIAFASTEAGQHFLSWLCGSGEQAYWEWMRAREQRDGGEDITALTFDYHTRNKGEFGPKVGTKCGRLDEGNT